MNIKLQKERISEFCANKYNVDSKKTNANIVLHIMELFDKHQDFVDHAFLMEFTSGEQAKFQQRYWEMFLSHHLTSLGYQLTRSSSGPDFGFHLDDKRVWIEAVAPERNKDIDIYYEQEARNGGGWFCADIFHLRWTAAIISKIQKYAAYLDKGWVTEDDICIVAVNSALLGSLGMTGITDYPAPVEVAFGVGAEYARVDKRSGRIVDQGYQQAPLIMKPTTAGTSPVPRNFFLKTGTRHISAILASSTKPETHGWPMIAVHNPFAKNPLPLGKIGAKWEYYAESRGDHFVLKTVVG